MNNPKISIITACFNSEETIARTISSVLAQKYWNYEHIFIDGGSKDKTVGIIKKMAPVAVLISEPDRGIYDAMNKGMSIAKGDILGTLNSDDTYADEDVLGLIAKAFESKEIDYFCAKIQYLLQDTDKFSHMFGQEPICKSNIRRMTLAHPTVYINKQLWPAIGKYDINYSIAADYDWTLRLLKRKYIYYYLDKPIVEMRLGGASSNEMENLAEVLKIKNVHFPERRIMNKYEFLLDASRKSVKHMLGKVRLDSVIKRIRKYEGKLG